MKENSIFAVTDIKFLKIYIQPTYFSTIYVWDSVLYGAEHVKIIEPCPQRFYNPGE